MTKNTRLNILQCCYSSLSPYDQIEMIMQINVNDIKQDALPINNTILLPDLLIIILLNIDATILTKPLVTFAKLINVVLLFVMAPIIAPA